MRNACARTGHAYKRVALAGIDADEGHPQLLGIDELGNFAGPGGMRFKRLAVPALGVVAATRQDARQRVPGGF